MMSWLRRLLARGGPAQPSSTIEVKPGLPRRQGGANRWLATALERAMERGQWSQADRIVESTGAVARTWPRVAEQIARYHLALGETEAALTMIDDALVQTASLRILRNVCLILLDRLPDARADLACWTTQSTAPLHARTLLALLEADRGAVERAMSLLRENLEQLEDPESLAGLLVLCHETGEERTAADWAARLHVALAARDESAFYDALLDAFGHDRNDALSPIPDGDAKSLALELISHEDVIPVLTAAQEIEHDPRTARVLAVAIELALPELVKPQVGYEALVRLALLASDLASARRWALTGHEACPLSASLARLSRDIDGIERQVRDEAASVDRDVIATIRPDNEIPPRGAAA